MANSTKKGRPDVLDSGHARRPRTTTTAPGRTGPRTGALVAGGVALTAVLATGGLALATRGSDEPVASAPSPQASAPLQGPTVEPAPTGSAVPAPAQVWRDAALVDLRPLTGLAVNLGTGINAWRSGTTTAAQTAAALDRFELALLDAKTAIDRRPALAAAPRAVVDLRLTADLYLAAVRAARVATAEPVGALQDQLVLQFSRLRNLGDRFFDQANAELVPLLGDRREIDGVTIVRVAEVPEWAALSLAAGPPLDTAPKAKPSPRAYQQDRPEQSLDGWLTAVRAAAVPSGDAEATALRTGTGSELGALARRLVSASDALYAAPDPRGERLVSTQVQLGLLVQAEAARAAQAATLVGGDSRARLTALAHLLAGSGDLAWDGRAGARSTGFPAR